MRKSITIPKIRFNNRVNSVNDLTAINSIIIDTFSKYISEIAKDYMQDYINQKVYVENQLTGGIEPKVYERTGDLLDAVTCTYTSKGEWKIGLDGRKIHARGRGSYTDSWGEHTGWGQHSDINGNSQAGNMATFINDGNNSPLFDYEGIDFINATQDYIDSIYEKEWIKFLTENNLQ